VLVTHRHNWGEGRVYFYDAGGSLLSLPTRWTSVCSPDPVVLLSDGRSAFRVRDLLELADLIRGLQAQGGDR
jgi:hypothetical protein